MIGVLVKQGKWVSLNCAIFPLLMPAPQTAPIGP
jgi:hypothetical protein